MLASDIPVKFRIPFAENAGAGFKTEPVPYTTTAPGRASLDLGFPPTTFDPVASGGNPPYGADMNGLMNQVTAWVQWATAGGFPTVYDATFNSQIGGYPQGGMLRSSTLSSTTGAQFWISAIDNNTSNPDTGGANWIPFPARNIQLQRPNYAADTGAVNSMVVALDPAPTTWAQIVGAPVRVKIGNTNSVTNPVININGIGAKTMINSDGTALAVGQLVAGCVLEGFPRDDDLFQVNSPPKSTSSSPWKPGQIITWPTETVPAGTLECNGATLNIADYPSLYAVILTRYGGDGVTTFKLPNYRGEFLRGWDHGRGLDPNAATRTNAGGGATGDHVGTNQTNQAGSVTVTGTAQVPYYEGEDAGGFIIGAQTGKSVSPTTPPEAYTGAAVSASYSSSESRPVNIYVMFCIAY